MMKLNDLLVNALQLPITGERSDILPFIIGGALLLIAVVLIVIKTRRKDGNDKSKLK